jgi:hypothetical protein
MTVLLTCGVSAAEEDLGRRKRDFRCGLWY